MDKLVDAVAHAIVDGMMGGPTYNANDAAREVLRELKPTHWEIEFPNGRVVVDSEVMALVNKANGYRVTPLYRGEAL